MVEFVEQKRECAFRIVGEHIDNGTADFALYSWQELCEQFEVGWFALSPKNIDKLYLYILRLSFKIGKHGSGGLIAAALVVEIAHHRVSQLRPPLRPTTMVRVAIILSRSTVYRDVLPHDIE